jgi:lipoic acid synthetase
MQDGGAAHFASCIRELRRQIPTAAVEVLTSDFNGDTAALDVVLNARPDIFNHNIETVERLTPHARSRAEYRRSMHVLRYAKDHGDAKLKTKSGLMLGLGEHQEEIAQTLRDLRQAGCEYLTLGQYLQPSARHLSIQSFVPIQEFDIWKTEAFRLGFERVASGPLVRSSYFADKTSQQSNSPLV